MWWAEETCWSVSQFHMASSHLYFPRTSIPMSIGGWAGNSGHQQAFSSVEIRDRKVQFKGGLDIRAHLTHHSPVPASGDEQGTHVEVLHTWFPNAKYCCHFLGGKREDAKHAELGTVQAWWQNNSSTPATPPVLQ